MLMTLLVTGGAGFVGSHFVAAAREDGREVVVLDDLSGGAAAPMPDGVTLVRGDIADVALVRRLCAENRVRAAVHFAGKIQVGESVRDPGLYYDVNLRRALVLLETLRHAGVAELVFSSTAAVYGTPREVPIPESAPLLPINPYGTTKLAFEQALDAYAAAYGMRCASLRYFNAAGAHPGGALRESHEPETHLLPLVLDAGLGRRPPVTLFGDDFPTPDGTPIRDYIHVVDLATAHLAALDRLAAGTHLGPLNLGTGSGFSVKQVLEVAAGVLGKPIPHTIGPRRPGDSTALVADASAARRALGWTPRRSDLVTIVEDALRSRR
jgi:UDP-glucose-4-epimerase GalE